MVEWSKATDCNSVITAGSNPAPTSTLNAFIMEEKNITPDKNLKYQPDVYEDYDEIIHPYYRNLLYDDPNTGFVYGDFITDDEPTKKRMRAMLIAFTAVFALLFILLYTICSK